MRGADALKRKTGQTIPPRDWASRVAIVADVFVVVSILIGVFTYLDQRRVSDEQKRRETAMQFVAMRNQDAYVDITKVLLESLTLKDRYKVSLGAQEEFKKSDAKDIIQEVGLGRIDAMAKFYSSVAICVKNELCDRGIIGSLFDKDIQFFYCATKGNLLSEIEGRLYAHGELYAPLRDYFASNIKTCPQGPTVGTTS